MSIKVNDSKDPVAEQDSLLVQVDYANQPIPNNRLPKGLYYSFKDKWVDMITLLTPAIKKIITANTTVPAWGSITGTLSNQTDLQSALDNKMSSDLTDSHIFVGDATNKATDVEMTGDVTIDNTGATTLANTAVTAGTYGDSTHYPTFTVNSKGLITSASQSAFPSSESIIVLFKSITKTIITGKTAETSIYSIPLPIDGFNYKMYIYSQAQTNTYLGSAISHRIRVGSYVAPIDGAVGANSIGQQTLLAMVSNTSTQSYPIVRNLSLYGGASGTIFGFPTNSLINDEVLGLQFITLATKDFTTQHYLYVSFNPSNVGAIVQHNQIYITLIKV